MGGRSVFQRRWQRFQRHRLLRKLIHPSDLALEIGSGNHPLRRSNSLLDKFVSVTAIHRTSNEKIRDFQGKPFILGDGRDLPFKDRSIDVVICRHVIEHVDDVIGFVQELQRVGKKGYLEWPSIFCELIRGGYGRQEQILDLFPARQQSDLRQLKHGEGTPGHRWFIVALGQRLYLAAKTRHLYPLYLMYGAYAKSLPQAKVEHLSWLTSFLVWSPDRPVEPILLGEPLSNDAADSLRESYDPEEQLACLRETGGGGVCPKWRELERRGVLCCPLCKRGDLILKNASYLCPICQREYSAVNGAWVFLRQLSNPGSSSESRGGIPIAASCPPLPLA